MGGKVGGLSPLCSMPYALCFPYHEGERVSHKRHKRHKRIFRYEDGLKMLSGGQWKQTPSA